VDQGADLALPSRSEGPFVVQQQTDHEAAEEREDTDRVGEQGRDEEQAQDEGNEPAAETMARRYLLVHGAHQQRAHHEPAQADVHRQHADRFHEPEAARQRRRG
jgi:hypothetical protein